MLGHQKIVALVPTAQAAAALAFYRDVLGLTLVEDTPFALVFSGGGTMVRVTKVASFTPQPFTVLGWEVADIAAAVAGLSARGAVFARFEGLAQDGLGVWDAPDGARVAWFQDPDGNVLSLTQFT